MKLLIGPVLFIPGCLLDFLESLIILVELYQNINKGVTKMKALLKPVFYGMLVSVLTLAGCDTESGNTTSSVPTEVSGSGSYYHVSPSAGSSIDYTHNLGSTPQDVFFIFTNANASTVSASSISSSVQSEIEVPSVNEIQTLKLMTGDPDDLVAWARENGVGLRGKPEVSAFNNNPPTFGKTEPGINYQMIAPDPLYTAVNDTNPFMNTSTSDTIAATARAVVTDGTITLNIWVEDDSWDTGCPKHYCITQAMVDAFADKFLQPGTENDIYDWVTSIYGAPWGSHSNGSLIAETDPLEIDILFYDIMDDGNDPGNSDPNGGVLGFFWAKDNYKTSSIDYSNGRLLFYMDSVLSAKEDASTSWTIDDYWPAEMVSTLAHEFQHMIHFYQKNVTYNVSPETWINEMASMVAEDLVADKVWVNGPRGVSYLDDTSGSTGNVEGRLPLYNYYNEISPTTWNNSSPLPNYAINYAFGAYLARNYGGAPLFQKIVQSNKTDYQAITSAVTASGYSETFTTLLQKWGVAVLLSDQTDMSSGYRYNVGGGFASASGDIAYNVGSINMFNYSYSGLNGPLFYTPSSVSNHNKLSNTYVKVGTAQTGTFTASVEMKSGVRLTVVTKDSN